MKILQIMPAQPTGDIIWYADFGEAAGMHPVICWALVEYDYAEDSRSEDHHREVIGMIMVEGSEDLDLVLNYKGFLGYRSRWAAELGISLAQHT